MPKRKKRHDSGEITIPIPADALRAALELDAAHHAHDRPTRPQVEDDLAEECWMALGELVGDGGTR